MRGRGGGQAPNVPGVQTTVRRGALDFGLGHPLREDG